jgi:hypothetical protein
MFHVVVTRSAPECDRAQPLDGRSGWTSTLRSWTRSLTTASSCSAARSRTSNRGVRATDAESPEAIRARLAEDRGARRTCTSS